jgi:hypothetical protein
MSFLKTKSKLSPLGGNIRRFTKVSLTTSITPGKIFINVSLLFVLSLGYPLDVQRSVDGIVKIPRSEAARLPNKTYPIQNEPGYYLAGLDVFHQLHCLVSEIASLSDYSK